MTRRNLALIAMMLTTVLAVGAQQAPPAQQAQPAQAGRGRGAAQPFDEARARQLYVSNKFEDHGKPNFQAAVDEKAKEDARYAEACKGVMECTKITYRSSVGDMDIPAYLFQPLQKGGPRSRPAMIWVHG